MWQYQVLKTGFFRADGGAMFGMIPQRVWQRRYRADAANRCILAMNCLLLWNDTRVILLDTGVGTKDLGVLSSYHFRDTEDIAAGVRKARFAPEQVTDVVLSHLHFDHCGGCTHKDRAGKLLVTFPQAMHWVGESQFTNYLSPHTLEKSSYRPADFMPVAESGRMTLLRDDSELYPGLRVSLHDGHTPGQIVVAFKASAGTVVFPGDVIPTKAHWSGEWISAYDTHPLESFDAKAALKQQLKKENAAVVFYHDAYTEMYDPRLLKK
ncbi:MAG: MBL fold metallo-hydrolase [Dysgonamonadaceae bacterium]|jgi:glyoxylase-like metal-dependent hydrolase (beta-lactamase superfamily II)|nr:MBL fold metallo-hydrolase [Dysgonamonadaceae bacterium]